MFLALMMSLPIPLTIQYLQVYYLCSGCRHTGRWFAAIGGIILAQSAVYSRRYLLCHNLWSRDQGIFRIETNDVPLIKGT